MLARSTDLPELHSGVPRTLAGSAYTERRAECERFARALGVASLRDVTRGQAQGHARARHVVAEKAGALGARLTGAGFGGAVVAARTRERAPEVAATAAARYRAETGREPKSWLVQAVDGAGRIDA